MFSIGPQQWHRLFPGPDQFGLEWHYRWDYIRLRLFCRQWRLIEWRVNVVYGLGSIINEELVDIVTNHDGLCQNGH